MAPLLPFIILLATGVLGRPRSEEFLAVYRDETQPSVNEVEAVEPSTLVPTTTTIETDEPPGPSQVVAVSVSSSVVRHRPVLAFGSEEGPTLSAAIQRSHFSVEEGPITIRKDDHDAVGSHFTVERSQNGEKSSLVVRQKNGQASSHFSIRQSHSPVHLHQVLPQLQQQSSHETTIPPLEGQQSTNSPVELQQSQTQVVLRQPNQNEEIKLSEEDRTDKERHVEKEEKREERTSYSVGRGREEKSYIVSSLTAQSAPSGLQSAPSGLQPAPNWEYQERDYEVDEAVSLATNGRAHGVQRGQVVEGRDFRRYRVEEKTPDGFIVGEYGVVSHGDGSLRGVRYTADSNTNPQLIYEALVKFLSLK